MKTIKIDTSAVETIQAYQHFLYYIDVSDIKKKQIWGRSLTNHFMEKLTGLINRSGKNYACIEAIVGWVQEMTPDNQEILTTYIMKNHLDKW